MTELEQLQTPPTDIEAAELVVEAGQRLTPAGMMILRRLAFHRDALTRQRDQLLAALEPFAEYARARDSYSGWAKTPDDSPIALCDGYGGSPMHAQITVGDVRRARAVIAAAQDREKPSC